MRVLARGLQRGGSLRSDWPCPTGKTALLCPSLAVNKGYKHLEDYGEPWGMGDYGVAHCSRSHATLGSTQAGVLFLSTLWTVLPASSDVPEGRVVSHSWDPRGPWQE